MYASQVDYYKSLFQDDGVYTPLSIRGTLPKLSEVDVGDLSCGIDLEEIWTVVKSMGAFKALGPNGFQVVFYHSQ